MVSTGKFTLQLSADRLLALSIVDGEAPDHLDEYAHLLSDLLAEFASSVRVSQSVGNAKHCWLHRFRHSYRQPLPCGSERVSGFLSVDESNSTPDTSAVKECVCDGICEGRALPDNMCISPAINPTRLKPKDHGQGIHVGREGGMEAHATISFSAMTGAHPSTSPSRRSLRTY